MASRLTGRGGALARAQIVARALAIAALGSASLALPALAQPALAQEDHAPLVYALSVNQLEHRWNEGDDGLYWNAQGFVGGDDVKLRLKAEGEAPYGEEVEEAEFQALLARRISDFFDAEAGVRYDLRPEPERAFLVLGIEGQSRLFFEVDGALFVSDEGEVSARLGGEYDLLITQKLVLQPKVEVNLAAQQVRERGVGSGLNDVEVGLRLGYRITPAFIPYLGVSLERSFGDSADFARDEGDQRQNIALVAGLRFWF